MPRSWFARKKESRKYKLPSTEEQNEIRKLKGATMPILPVENSEALGHTEQNGKNKMDAFRSHQEPSGRDTQRSEQLRETNQI